MQGHGECTGLQHCVQSMGYSRVGREQRGGGCRMPVCVIFIIYQDPRRVTDEMVILFSGMSKVRFLKQWRTRVLGAAGSGSVSALPSFLLPLSSYYSISIGCSRLVKGSEGIIKFLEVSVVTHKPCFLCRYWGAQLHGPAMSTY